MKKITSLLLFILFLISCNNENNEVEDSFDTRAMITDITNQLILPKINLFDISCKELNTEIVNFLENITEENLVKVQKKWDISASLYAEIYAFNIGESKNQYYDKKLYNWPTYGLAIENFILNNETITQENVNAISSQAKTLSGIEYLIFNGTKNEINNSFLNSGNRKEYLKLISEYQIQQSSALSNLWATDGENFKSRFINNNETGLKSSLNLIYNGVYNAIATAKITKIGKTAGLENSEIVNLNELQAPYKKYTKELIFKNIQISKNVFFNDQGLGLSNNIYAITGDNELNNLLKNKFDTVLNSLTNLDGNLANAISNSSNDVRILHQQLQELLVILSVDVRSTLSIIITATDNDGD